MSRAFEAGISAKRHFLQMVTSLGQDYNSNRLLNKLRKPLNTYLVVETRRDHVLEDALNQLWRREKRELLRPLKVRLGTSEGEEGVDHGGIQLEFFRLVMAEALRPEYGEFFWLKESFRG
jgi:hypothetical protein